MSEQPILAKISELDELLTTDAADQLAIVDASEADATKRTKRTRMDKLRLTAAAQIADGIVANTKLATGAVTSAKIGASAVIAGKIATGGVSASSQIASGIVTNSQLAAGAALANLGAGTVDTVKIADGAITQAKLGAINRTVAIPVFGLEDNIIVKNFSRIFAWPPYVNNHVIIGASAVVLGAVSTSGTIGITLINQGGTLATISIAAGQWSANSGSINSSLRTALSFATFSVNVTASGSGAKGLTIYLQIQG